MQKQQLTRAEELGGAELVARVLEAHELGDLELAEEALQIAKFRVPSDVFSGLPGFDEHGVLQPDLWNQAMERAVQTTLTKELTIVVSPELMEE